MNRATCVGHDVPTQMRDNLSPNRNGLTLLTLGFVYCHFKTNFYDGYTCNL